MRINQHPKMLSTDINYELNHYKHIANYNYD